MSESDVENDYRTFRDEKARGTSGAAIVAFFGSRLAAEYELRYQADKAAGLISISFHDDAVGCGMCGKKHCVCPPFTRAEWNRTLR